jgi:hypothetical protein
MVRDRQAVPDGTSWFRGSTLRVELPVAVPGPACAAQTTCALASERSGSTMHRESEPATSSLRYAIGRARSAPALHKIGPAEHRLPAEISLWHEKQGRLSIALRCGGAEFVVSIHQPRSSRQAVPGGADFEQRRRRAVLRPLSHARPG